MNKCASQTNPLLLIIRDVQDSSFNITVDLTADPPSIIGEQEVLTADDIAHRKWVRRYTLDAIDGGGGVPKY